MDDSFVIEIIDDLIQKLKFDLVEIIKRRKTSKKDKADLFEDTPESND